MSQNTLFDGIILFSALPFHPYFFETVHRFMLSRMAQEFQLFPIYKEGFRNFYNEHRQQPAYRHLMEYMNVVNADGEFLMDEEQLEAASAFFNPFCCLPLTGRRYIRSIRVRKALIITVYCNPGTNCVAIDY